MYFLAFGVGLGIVGPSIAIVETGSVDANGHVGERQAFERLKREALKRSDCPICSENESPHCRHFRRLFDRTPYESETEAREASKEFLEYSPMLFAKKLADGTRRILSLDESYPDADTLRQSR